MSEAGRRKLDSGSRSRQTLPAIMRRKKSPGRQKMPFGMPLYLQSTKFRQSGKGMMCRKTLNLKLLLNPQCPWNMTPSMRSVLPLHRWNPPALSSIRVVLHSAIRLGKLQVTKTPRGGFCRNAQKCAPTCLKTPIPFGQEASRNLYGQLILHRLLPSRWQSSGLSNRATCSERGFGQRAFLHQSLLPIQHRKPFLKMPRHSQTPVP